MNPILKSLRDHIAACTSLPTGITTDSVFAGGVPPVIPSITVMMDRGNDTSLYIEENPRQSFPVTIIYQVKYTTSATANATYQDQLNTVLRWLEDSKVANTTYYEFKPIESLVWSGSAYDLDSGSMRFQVAFTIEVVDLRR